MKTSTIIELSPQELENLISKVVAEKLKVLTPTQSKKETILTVEETQKMLSVDRSTLHRWNTKGILRSRKIANLTRYYLSDIEKILEGQEEG